MFENYVGISHHLNRISDIICRNLNRIKPLIVTFFDLIKAFGTFNHKLLYHISDDDTWASARKK